MEQYIPIELTAQEFANRLGLEVLYDTGKKIKFETPTVTRVGLQLAGYFEAHSVNRTQVLGPNEVYYLQNLRPKQKVAVVESFFVNQFPCVIFSRNLEVDKLFIKYAKQYQIPIFRSADSTSKLVNEAAAELKQLMAPTVQLHGVLMDIDGVGIMITGASGIGKSEIALELIRRGHRIVADDIIVVKRLGNMLEGSANPLVKNFMELRGVGLVNIVQLCGVESIKLYQQVELVIELEKWDSNKTYERLGPEGQYEEILGVKLQKIVIPVSPGRNIAVVIETAASVFRLWNMGYNAMDELAERMKNQNSNK